MANETTITANMRVTGIGELEKAANLFDRIRKGSDFKMNGGGISKMAADITKATEGAERMLSMFERLKSVGNMNTSFGKMTSEITKATSSAERFNAATRDGASGSSRLVSGAEKLASAETRSVQQAEKFNSLQNKSSSGLSRQTEQYNKSAQAAKQASEHWNNQAKAAEKTATSSGKMKMALKDSFAMFGAGQLGMQAVMSATQGIKNLFKSGYETIKERQQGEAMWATSIEDAHPNVKGSALTYQSNKANRMIMSTSIKAGNDFSEGNAMAKQIYSSDAGSYSGNLKKTNSLVKGMFNIQDANALTNMDMLRMRTSVGNIGDIGKMSSNIAKSLNLLDGKMTRAIRKEYKKETGHDLAKTKNGNYDWSQVSAETAYAGLDKYGNSGGVGKASKRYNSTLGGMVRAGKAAINNGMADFEEAFVGNINKKFGGKGSIIAKLSGVFTDQNKISGFAKGAANSLTNVAGALAKIGKIGIGAANAVKPFATGFAKGFVSELKAIGSGINSAYGVIKGIGSKIKNALPKGTGDAFKNITSGLGSAAGKITAFLVALRGFSKLPKMAGVVSKIISPVSRLLEKVPLVGKTLSSLMTAITGVKPQREMSAATKMMSAGDKMLSAAGKMNGGSGDGSYDGPYGNGTRSNRKPSLSTRLKTNGAAYLSDGVHSKGASWLDKLKGNTLTKLGGVVEKVSGSKFGTAMTKVSGVMSKVGGRFSASGGALTAAFGAVDIANAFGSTKAGSLSRHKAVGSATGSTLGSVLGGMAGIGLGPLGVMAGSMIGGTVGSKAGSWFGSLFGGKNKKPDKTVSQYAQEASNKVQRQEMVNKLVSGGGAADKSTANAQVRTLSKASSIKNKKSQYYAAKAQNDLSNGDTAAYQKDTAAAAKSNAQYYAKAAKSAKSKVASDKASVSEAKKNLKASKGTDAEAGYRAQLDKAQKKLTKDKKATTKAQKAANKADKDSQKLGNKSVSKKKKSNKDADDSKDHKKGTKAADKHAKSNKKVGDSNKKSADKSKKALSGLTKSQAKELKKQTKSLKKENKKQAALVKSANKKTKAAKKAAAKDIAKADKSAAKAMSKNYKTSSKQISKAIKSGMKTAAKAAKTGSKNIAKNVKSGLKNVGKSSKTAFKGLSKSVKSGFKSAKSAAKSGAKGIVSATKSGLNKMNTAGKSAGSKLSKSIKSGFSKAKSAAQSGAKGVVSAAKSGLSKMGSAGTSGTSKLASSVQSGMNKVTSAVKSGMSKANSAMKSGFSKMQSAASSAAGRVGSSMNKIGSSASSAASKVKSLASAINSLHSKTVTITANVKGKGSSKLATGTPSFDHLATGTPRPGAHLAGGWASNGGVHAGMYTVNDAPGTRFREAFKIGNLVGLFPNKRNLKVPLPEGAQVLNGEDTHKTYPHLATGTPGAKGTIKKAVSKAGMVVNVTINIAGDATEKTAQTIANAIGEKLNQVYPQVEV